MKETEKKSEEVYVHIEEDGQPKRIEKGFIKKGSEKEEDKYYHYSTD